MVGMSMREIDNNAPKLQEKTEENNVVLDNTTND